jgi:ribose 5-phosphate isomerase A
MVEDLIELGKKNAAIKAVKDNVKEGMVIGIGSGSTVVYAVQEISKINKIKDLGLKCIPTSFQSRQLILDNKLELATLDQYPNLDLDIDGADEVDSNLNLIKGGGGCHVQEKIVASVSKKVVIVVDFRKKSELLGENWKRGIPVEVIPLGYIPIKNKLKEIGGNPVLRIAKNKMGPVVSDNGNFILDVDFGTIKNPSEIDNLIKNIPGVVDTGLFLGMTSSVYIGQKDGSVKVLKK